MQTQRFTACTIVILRHRDKMVIPQDIYFKDKITLDSSVCINCTYS